MLLFYIFSYIYICIILFVHLLFVLVQQNSQVLSHYLIRYLINKQNQSINLPQKTGDVRSRLIGPSAETHQACASAGGAQTQTIFQTGPGLWRDIFPVLLCKVVNLGFFDYTKKDKFMITKYFCMVGTSSKTCKK